MTRFINSSNKPVDLAEDKPSRYPSTRNEEGSEELFIQRCILPADKEDIRRAIFRLSMILRNPQEALLENDVGIIRWRMAGVAPRLSALKLHDLTNWKKAVKALYLTCYGPFTAHNSDITEVEDDQIIWDLVIKVLSLKNRRDAYYYLEGFRQDKELSYHVECVIEALQAITISSSTKKRRLEAIERIAILAGLANETCKFKFYFANQSPTMSCERARTIWCLLSIGEAQFAGDLNPLLGFWASKVAPKGKIPEKPTRLTMSNVKKWVLAVLKTASSTQQFVHPPQITDDTKDQLLIEWDGRIVGEETPGRRIPRPKMTLIFTVLEGEVIAHLKWSAGDGLHPVFDFGIELALADINCISLKEPNCGPPIWLRKIREE